MDLKTGPSHQRKLQIRLHHKGLVWISNLTSYTPFSMITSSKLMNLVDSLSSSSINILACSWILLVTSFWAHKFNLAWILLAMFLVIGPLASLGGSWLASTHLANQNTHTTRKISNKRKFTQVVRITSQFLAFLVALWNHNPQIFQQVETKKKLETYS